MMPKNICCKYSCPAIQSPIRCNPALKAHYEYWDRFVQEWIEYNYDYPNGTSWQCYNSLREWKCPEFNNSDPKKNLNDSTIHYLPEPWWGNNGTHPLHSVVINFNPGEGGYVQKINHKKCRIVSITNYSDFINTEICSYIPNNPPKGKSSTPVLYKSNNWHYMYRCKPIADTLLYAGNQITVDLRNHLSIELLPWHSYGFANDVEQYAQNNVDAIIEYSIRFAVEISKNICNDKLNNIVLFRISLPRLTKIFDKKSNPYITNYEIKTYPRRNCISFENADFAEFKIIKEGGDLFPDTRLISIWQPHRTSVNNFPYSADMARIFGNL